MHTIYPLGHFYSPMVNNDEAKKDEARIWPVNPEILGIDFNDDSHREFLGTIIPQCIGKFDYPQDEKERKHEYDFYQSNNQFGYFDALMLFAFLLHTKPKRVIEIGSGYSSLITADVNRRFFNNSIEFLCIEPYPIPMLQRGVPGISVLIQERVQDVPFLIFERLQPGDILFIDSSHVSKTGSDVVHLYFEVLPRLQPGINIHIHDIFLPFDYPKNWVIDEGRGWNEQYLLQALLMYSNTFSVIYGCEYAAYKFSELLISQFGKLPGGGNFWIHKG
jgi:hypothetical protein